MNTHMRTPWIKIIFFKKHIDVTTYVKVILKFVNKPTFRKDGNRYRGGSSIPHKI